MRPWKRLELGTWYSFVCSFTAFDSLHYVRPHGMFLGNKRNPCLWLAPTSFGKIGKENKCNNKQCNKPYTRSMSRVLSGLRGQCNFAHRRLGIDPRGSGRWTETSRIEVHQNDRLGLREEGMPGKRHSMSNGIKIRKRVFCWENLLIFKRTKDMMSCAGRWWTKRQRVEHCTLLPASGNIPSVFTMAVHADHSFCQHWVLCLGAFPGPGAWWWCTEWTKVLTCWCHKI